jgi:hypothetical protein
MDHSSVPAFHGFALAGLPVRSAWRIVQRNVNVPSTMRYAPTVEIRL